MKQLKLLIVMLLAIVASTLPLHAQKGMQGFGADIFYGRPSPTNYVETKYTDYGENVWNNIGIDIFYRYNVSDLYCIQPHVAFFSIGHSVKWDELKFNKIENNVTYIGTFDGNPPSIGFELGIDNHLTYKSGGKFVPYLNLGISYYKGAGLDMYGDWDYDYGTLTRTDTQNIEGISTSSLLIKGGLGINLRISYNISFNAEANFAMGIGGNPDGYDGSSFWTMLQAKAGLVYTF